MTPTSSSQIWELLYKNDLQNTVPLRRTSRSFSAIQSINDIYSKLAELIEIQETNPVKALILKNK